LSVNCLVDITSVLNQKILAANAYSSQLRERPYKDIFLGLMGSPMQKVFLYGKRALSGKSVPMLSLFRT
jgi:hypothetical protein